MKNNIQLEKPQEVLVYISHESKLLNQYAELISQETKKLLELENYVSSTIQLINSRKQGIYTAIEQTRRRKDSVANQKALKAFREKLYKYENQAFIIRRCSEELISIRQDYMNLVKDSMCISDTGKVLSEKIQVLINKLIEAQ